MEVTINKIAYIGATMDLIHSGHINIINEAKKLANYVIVALNTDEFVARFKRKPIMTLSERLTVISNLKNVDLCIVNDANEHGEIMLERYKPNFVLFGSDYTFERYKKQLGVTDEFLTKYNIQLIQVPYTSAISTTDLINRCKLH